MTEQFGLAVDAALLDDLVVAFPTASGRDIKAWPSWWPNIAITARCRRRWTCSGVARYSRHRFGGCA